MKNNVLKIILIISIVIVGCMGLLSCYIRYLSPQIEYKELNSIDIKVNACIDENNLSNIYSMSKQEIRNELNEIFGRSFYVYKESSGGTCGVTLFFLNTIIIRSDLNNVEYLKTLAHELVHITTLNGHERMTEFNTFVKLYDSKFRNVAISIAKDHFQKRLSEEYDCAFYIHEFLLDKMSS